MYNYFVHVITCTKSQLVHDIYIYIDISFMVLPNKDVLYFSV